MVLASLLLTLNIIACWMQPFKPFAQDTVSRRCSVKKMFLGLSQNSQENICARVSLQSCMPQSATLLKKDSAQVLPCKFCEISQNIFSSGYLRWLLLLLLVTIDKFCCIVFKKQMLAVLKRSAALKICGKMSIIKCNFSVATTSLL